MLAYAPGSLYLAGPYHGSPLSIVAIDSATVGPFDLGVIVVRSAIRVDPHTAQVSIDSAGSDPIPHILDGIPLHLRDIRVYIDRPNFTLNPTSCEPFAVASTLTGSGAPFSDPADDIARRGAAPLPGLLLLLARLRPQARAAAEGGHPARRLPLPARDVTPRAGDANIGQRRRHPAAVDVPRPGATSTRSAPGRSSRPKPARPARSTARASAITPLLDEPLEGPVYLRASGNERALPDLVAELTAAASASSCSAESTPSTAACAPASKTSPTPR